MSGRAAAATRAPARAPYPCEVALVVLPRSPLPLVLPLLRRPRPWPCRSPRVCVQSIQERRGPRRAHGPSASRRVRSPTRHAAIWSISSPLSGYPQRATLQALPLHSGAPSRCVPTASFEATMIRTTRRGTHLQPEAAHRPPGCPCLL
eukprot:1770958-Prymnesium_polylepis.1